MKLASGTVLPAVGQVPGWRRGTAAARALRDQQNLDGTPISNNQLAEMGAISVSALEPGQTTNTAFSFALDQSPARGRVVLRSKWEAGRRFELARLIGDRLVSAPGSHLLPATHSVTYRQKYQRAFAAELLCPFDALEHTLRDDYSLEAIQDAAAYFSVSPLTVRTLLVNHERLAREELDEGLDI